MKSIIATGLLAAVVTAQSQYSIDPNSVDESTRKYWCQQQQAQCPLICLQTAANSATTTSNDCDPSALTYSCVCDNGISPNISEYSQTLPYYICTQWGQQCVSNCNGDTACASACTQDHPCGASNPTRQNTSTLTRTMSKTASAGASGSGSEEAAATTDGSGQTIYSGFAGDSPSSTGGNGGSGGGDSSAASSTLVRVWALSAGQTFGTLALVGGIVGGFAMLL
ncbi:hypothetical protein M409DRAFT_57073 [Zasmidium cellare ATCC 36951]|uniref:DUF7707 domain-containing protein n=1 Tax=Zasmidium cellare ATCC 36951 TaxID=1080233 RepID=A0A6A6CCM1_ZASCE|nr:uncharacterized protein M409DRAFT_57073 [Zasmidium cellare ATCC 36951]KAF2163970.1 hypothetical protein M409DRAFT_57073 [Zasmidium cellare ATCC 36951]